MQDSDTYFRFDKTDVSDTRASYVTPSDYYTLENVEPAKNENGEVLEGEWVATVRTQGEANFRNVSDLHLVVNYTDAAGVAQQVSSSGVPIEIVSSIPQELTSPLFSLLELNIQLNIQLNIHITD